MSDRSSHTDKYPSQEALVAGPVTARWYEGDGDEVESSVILSLDGLSHLDGCFDGYITTDEDGNRVMHAGTVSIPQELEGHHLGEKLTQALGYEAVSQGCKKMTVDFRHPASLKAFIKVFGYDRIHFEDAGELTDFPVDEQGVLKKVIANWGFAERGGRPPSLKYIQSVKATVNLKGLDVAYWPVPIATEASDSE